MLRISEQWASDHGTTQQTEKARIRRILKKKTIVCQSSGLPVPEMQIKLILLRNNLAMRRIHQILEWIPLQAQQLATLYTWINVMP